MEDPQDARRREMEREFLKGEAPDKEPTGILGQSDPSGRVRVGFHNGLVMMDMGGELGAVGLVPDQAKELARKLLKYANPVTRP